MTSSMQHSSYHPAWEGHNLSEDQYTKMLTELADKKPDQVLILKDNSVKTATKAQKMWQAFKGFFGFENKADPKKVNYELLKLLRYGENCHYFDKDTVQQLVTRLKDKLQSGDHKIVADAIGDILNKSNVHQAKVASLEGRITKYHDDNKNELHEAFWTVQIPKQIAFQPTDMALVQHSKGRIFASEKKYSEAINEFKAAVEVVPDRTDWKLDLAKARIEHGKQLVNENKLDEARTVFEEVATLKIDQIPKKFKDDFEPLIKHAVESQVDIALSLAAMHESNNDHEKALKEIQDAHNLSPTDLTKNRLLSQLSKMEEATHDNEQKIDYLKQQLSLSPEDVTAHQKLGALYQSINDIANARTHFEKVATSSESSEAHSSLGNLAFKQKDFAKAIEHYQAAIRIASDKDKLRIASQLLDAGDAIYDENKEAGLKAYRLALPLLDKRTIDHARLLIIYLRLADDDFKKNNFGDSINYFENIHQLQPNDQEVIRSLIDVYKQIGNIEKTYEYSQRLSALNEGDKDIHLQNSYLAKQLNKDDEAIRHAKKAMELAPNDATIVAHFEKVAATSKDPDTQETLGDLVFNKIEYDKALEHYTKSGTLAGSNDAYITKLLACHLGLAEQAKGAGHIAQMMTHYNDAINIAKDKHQIASQLLDTGDALFEQDPENALKAYRLALHSVDKERLDTDRLITIYHHLADEEFNKGSLLESAKHLEEIYNLEQSDQNVMRSLFDIHKGLGNLDEAYKWANRLLAADPQNLDVHKEVGKLYEDNGNTDKAYHHFLQASRIDNEDPQTFVALGNLDFTKNDYDMALSNFSVALPLTDNPDERVKIAKQMVDIADMIFAEKPNDALEVYKVAAACFEVDDPKYKDLPRLQQALAPGTSGVIKDAESLRKEKLDAYVDKITEAMDDIKNPAFYDNLIKIGEILTAGYTEADNDFIEQFVADAPLLYENLMDSGPEKAKILLKQVLALNPQDVEALSNLFFINCLEKNWTEATPLAITLNKNDPSWKRTFLDNDIDDWEFAVFASKLARRFEESVFALRHAKEALDLAPNEPDVIKEFYNVTGELKTDNVDSAIKACKDILIGKPDEIKILQTLANLYLQKGEPDSAKPHLEKVEVLKKALEEQRIKAAEMMQQRASSSTGGSGKKGPKVATTVDGSGMMMMERPKTKGKKKEEIEENEEEDLDADAVEEEGLVVQGDVDESNIAMDDVAKDADIPMTAKEEQELLAEIEEKEVVPAMEDLLKAEDSAAIEAYAKEELKNKRYENALKCYTRALELKPDNEEVVTNLIITRFLLAKQAKANEEFPEMLEHLSKALDVAKTENQRTKLVQKLVEEGKEIIGTNQDIGINAYKLALPYLEREKKLEVLEAIIQTEAADAEIYADAAKMQFAGGKYENALKYYSKALELNPANEAVIIPAKILCRVKLAAQAKAEKQYQKVVSHLENALKIAKTPDARSEVAKQLAAEGSEIITKEQDVGIQAIKLALPYLEGDEKLDALEDLLDEGKPDAQISAEAAQMQFEGGYHDLALENLKDAYRLDPNDKYKQQLYTTTIAVARLNEGENKLTEAHKLYQEALKLASSSQRQEVALDLLTLGEKLINSNNANNARLGFQALNEALGSGVNLSLVAPTKLMVAHTKLAEAAVTRNDFTTAIHNFEIAVSLAPTDANLLQRLIDTCSRVHLTTKMNTYMKRLSAMSQEANTRDPSYALVKSDLAKANDYYSKAAHDPEMVRGEIIKLIDGIKADTTLNANIVNALGGVFGSMAPEVLELGNLGRRGISYALWNMPAAKVEQDGLRACELLEKAYNGDWSITGYHHMKPADMPQDLRNKINALQKKLVDMHEYLENIKTHTDYFLNSIDFPEDYFKQDITNDDVLSRGQNVLRKVKEYVRNNPSYNTPYTQINALDNATSPKAWVHKAVEHYYKALQRNPESIGPHVNRVAEANRVIDAVYQLGGIVDAYKMFEGFSKEFPNTEFKIDPQIFAQLMEMDDTSGFDHAILARGILVYAGQTRSANDHTTATKAYLKGLSMCSKDDYRSFAIETLHYADQLRASRQYDLAVKLYDTVTASPQFLTQGFSNAELAEFYANGAKAAKDRGQTINATHYYNLALAKEPHNARINCELGDLYHSEGKNEEALAHYREAYLADKTNTEFIEKFRTAGIQKGNSAYSVVAANELNEKLKELASFTTDESKALYAKDIRKALRSSLGEWYSEYRQLQNLGTSANNFKEIKSNFTLALTLLRKAYDGQSGHMKPEEMPSDLKDRIEAAEAQLNFTTSQVSGILNEWTALDLTETNIQKLKEDAIYQYLRANQIDGTFGDHCNRLIDVFCCSGRYEDALEYYEEFREQVDPGRVRINPYVYINNMDSLIAENKLPAAISFIKAATQIIPDSLILKKGLSHALYLQAQKFLEAKEYDRALTYFKRAITCGVDAEPACYQKLADLYWLGYRECKDFRFKSDKKIGWDEDDCFKNSLIHLKKAADLDTKNAYIAYEFARRVYTRSDSEYMYDSLPYIRRAVQLDPDNLEYMYGFIMTANLDRNREDYEDQGETRTRSKYEQELNTVGTEFKRKGGMMENPDDYNWRIYLLWGSI